MKKITLIAAFVAAHMAAMAQGVEFIEPRNVQHVSRPEITTFTVNDRYYVMYDMYNMSSPISHDVQLDVYDAKTMKPLGTHDIDKTIPQGDANIFAGIYALADQLVMFKYEYEKGKGTVLYYYLISEKGERGEGIELASFPAEKAMNSGNFEVNVSDDGTKIAVLCELPHIKDALEQQAIIYVFDNSFKELWKKEYSFPYASEKAPRNTLFVNNSGVVFNLKQIPVKKSLDFFSMFTFTNNGANMVETKVDLGENGMISSYKSAFTASGDLQLVGYYYPNKKTGVNVETPVGVFMVKASADDGSLPVSKISTFDPQQNIKALYLLPQNDNGFILVGEREYNKSTPRQGAAFEYDYDHNMVDIIAVRINSDGSKAWDYTIKRDVKSRNDGGRFLTCYAGMVGNKLAVVYYDYFHKHDGEKHTVVGPLLAGIMVDVVEFVDEHGAKAGEQYIADARIGGKKGEYYLIPATGQVVNNNTLFFIGARGMELVGVKLTL